MSNTSVEQQDTHESIIPTVYRIAGSLTALTAIEMQGLLNSNKLILVGAPLAQGKSSLLTLTKSACQDQNQVLHLQPDNENVRTPEDLSAFVLQSVSTQQEIAEHERDSVLNEAFLKALTHPSEQIRLLILDLAQCNVQSESVSTWLSNALFHLAAERLAFPIVVSGAFEWSRHFLSASFGSPIFRVYSNNFSQDEACKAIRASAAALHATFTSGAEEAIFKYTRGDKYFIRFLVETCVFLASEDSAESGSKCKIGARLVQQIARMIRDGIIQDPLVFPALRSKLDHANSAQRLSLNTLAELGSTVWFDLGREERDMLFKIGAVGLDYEADDSSRSENKLRRHDRYQFRNPLVRDFVRSHIGNLECNTIELDHGFDRSHRLSREMVAKNSEEENDNELRIDEATCDLIERGTQESIIRFYSASGQSYDLTFQTADLPSGATAGDELLYLISFDGEQTKGTFVFDERESMTPREISQLEDEVGDWIGEGLDLS